ncbi:hypothetical protein [Ferruginibacter sp.]
MIKIVLYKKPIIFIIGFLFFMVFSKAQNLRTAKAFFEQKDFARAKESMDSFVLINENNAEGWLLKANIYDAISKDAEVRYLAADSKMEAFEALKKAKQLNSDFVTDQLKPTNYNLPFDLYNGYTNEGLAYFNAGAERNDKGSYSEALNKFKNAGLVSNYIYNNSWGLSAIDTNNIFYSAKAAINSGKETEALYFAKKIADAGITQSAASKVFESIYKWLVYYCKQQKDGENFSKYTAMAMQKFPAAVYFNLIMIDWLRQQEDYINLFVAYEALLKKQPDSKYQFAYLNDVYNYLYQSKVEINNKSLYEGILKKGLLQYLKTNTAAFDARLLIGKFYSNKANDARKEMVLRSTTDAKVLNGYKMAQRNFLLQSNVYLKEIVNKFSKSNRVVYKEALELLILNYLKLNLKKEARRYQRLLALVTFICFILFNIILIIGIIVSFTYRYS